jgi:uncharacterized protein (DUF608 family)
MIQTIFFASKKSLLAVAILAGLLLNLAAQQSPSGTPANPPEIPPRAQILAPEDKQLDPAWVSSLTKRGHALDAKIRGSKEKDTLKFIGMPVGGIGCGTVYLGGDGRLWVWDIFNEHRVGVIAQNHTLSEELNKMSGRDMINPVAGANYVNPFTPDTIPPAFEQGFGIRIGDQFRRFEEKDWAEVEFEGNWPIGTVIYRDPAMPVEVKLRGFSPFIPLNLDDSSLPITFMEFTVRNTSSEPVTADLSGWLENAVGMNTRKSIDLQMETGRSKHGSLKLITHGAGVQKDAGVKQDFNFKKAGDFGTFALGVMDDSAEEISQDGAPGWSSRLFLQPGESKQVVFLLAWHFPNIMEEITSRWIPSGVTRREYVSRFEDAAAVALYAAEHYQRLADTTRLWVDTWYDSTLPEWFMDRTLLTTNTLQTSNCYILEDGQFWAWEGVGICAGTCIHVWQYAQGIARLFPPLERNLREKTDYAYAQQKNGAIRMRGVSHGETTDGQAGVILRTYREHLLSPDAAFLHRVWPQTKRALQWLIDEDGNADGILEGAQKNTLDKRWYGPVAWISGHYLAALLAGVEMARIVGDTTFATEAEAIIRRGQVNLVERLFNGEYFINLPDPEKPGEVNSGTGSHIDQVLGQSWAFQVGLGRIFPEQETQSALTALWKYNFFPDVGVYRAQNLPGRWYALPGESGLLMTTFPDPNWDFEKASGGGHARAQYFNECMSGFEYQVASHMVFEGAPALVEKGLAITRAVHDRYSPERRNPYNEVEASDHYARAAASYGVFLAACGFEYDGPGKRIGFAPRVSPENFKAPFTAAEGWGSYSQKQSGTTMQATIDVKYGHLSLRTIVLQMPAGALPEQAVVKMGGETIPCEVTNEDGRTVVQLSREVVIPQGQTLSLSL